LVALDRKNYNFKNNNVCEYNRTDMAGENPRRIQLDFFLVGAPPIEMLVYGKIKGKPPRSQFLWLPLDVNSL
jgi:hypothetical protein